MTCWWGPEGDDPFQAALLDTYADAHDEVCVADAASTTAGATTVELVGDVAVVVPGADVGTLPDGARAGVLALREVSPSADVAAAVSLALGEPIEVGTRRVRRFFGLPSLDGGWTHYETSVEEVVITVEALGAEDLPLAFITPARLSPEAATLVGGLRLNNRAAILGYDVYASVAESTWRGVASRGLLSRTSTLLHQESAWPDVVPADTVTDAPEDHLDQVASMVLGDVGGGCGARRARRP